MPSDPSITLHSVPDPTLPIDSPTTPISVTSTSSTEEPDTATTTAPPQPQQHPRTHLLPARPKLPSRQSSGTLITPSTTAGDPMIDDAGHLDEDDVRSMSPRRSSAELARLSETARQDMMEQARELQASLQAIVERVETVKSEHEKLEGGNKFLSSCVFSLSLFPLWPHDC